MPAAAQTNKASIVGTVVDPNGAVVPNATVTVTNVATNQAREVTTNGDGQYVVAAIDIGNYRVEAVAANFSKATVEDVILETDDRLTIDVTLGVAGSAEVVTVSASDEPLVQRETSTRGETITGKEITELPLSGRNFTELATLAPGVSRSYTAQGVDNQAFNQGDPGAGSVPGLGDSHGQTEGARFARSGGASISVNGQRPSNNNFSLDGVDNNEPQFGSIGVFPPPDAIQEFKVETSIPRAEVGRAAGAVINTSFRSGTNEFHGSAYYYGQNDNLNATHTITNRNHGTKPELQIHEFGFTIGGPIIKDRTFFFFDYQGQRNHIPHDFNTNVPTAKSRIGDFSDFDTPVIDPLTGLPFPGNRIPNLQDRPDFSPAAFAFLNFYPLPNRDVRNPNVGNPNFFGTRNNKETIDQFDVKVDHRLGDNDTINGRFSFQNLTRSRANFFPVIPTAGFGAGDELGDTRQVAISQVHTFSPTILNEARFGWTSIKIGILNTGIGGTQGINPNFSADLGIPNTNDGTFERSGGMLVGGFGNGEFEFSGDGGPFLVDSDNFYFADSVTIVRGNHTFKAGTEVRHRLLHQIDGGRSGGLKGHLQYCSGAFCGDAIDIGNVQAEMLLNVPAHAAFSGSIPGGAFNLRQNEFAFFVQDDWKVNDQLTLNLGLRYDVNPSMTERDARIGNFDLNRGVVVLASDSGDSLVETDKNNFGPRIGAAYSFGKDRDMVVRGGYGIVYTPDAFDRPPLVNNPPFTNAISFGQSGGFTFATGPPLAPAVDPNDIPANVTVFFVEPKQKVGYVHQFNITYEWGFADNWVFNIGYVGNRSRDLLTTRNLGSDSNGLGLAQNANGDFISNLVAYENRSNSSYDGMQSSIERRFANGFQARASYTFSKTIDQSTGAFSGPADGRGSRGGPVNPFDENLDGEKGISSLDVRHLFSGNIIYELPFGKGRRWADEGGVMNEIAGGWQVSFLFNGRSGQPFTVVQGDVRPDQIGDPFKGSNDFQFLDRAAFSCCSNSVTNLAGHVITFGSLGRNTFRGPSSFRTDFSFSKEFPIHESMQLEWGMDFFNVFNSSDYFVPSNNVNNGDFGQLTNALPPRIIQYRLKFLF